MVFKASNFCNIFDSEILDSEFNLKKNFKNSSIRKKRDRFGGQNLISSINKTTDYQMQTKISEIKNG